MTKAARSMCGLNHPPGFLLKKVELIPRLRTWPLLFGFSRPAPAAVLPREYLHLTAYPRQVVERRRVLRRSQALLAFLQLRSTSRARAPTFSPRCETAVPLRGPRPVPEPVFWLTGLAV